MSGALRQVSAARLGGGRWRIGLQADGPWRHGAPPQLEELGVQPADTALAAPVVEALSGARGRWSLVLRTRDGRVGTRYQLHAGNHEAWRVSLLLDEAGLIEPQRGDGRSAVVEPLRDIDYTARDYTALQPVLMAAVYPQGAAPLQTSPVTEAVAVVEQLAYVGDSLSYQQDAIATESHLSTCRRRVSAARHAALLDYDPGENVSARAWVRLELGEGHAACTLPAGTRLIAGAHAPTVVAPGDVEDLLAAGATAFETVHPVELHPSATLLPLTVGTAGSTVKPAVDGTSVTATGMAGPGLRAPAPSRLALLEPVNPGDGPGHVVRLTAAEQVNGDRWRLAWHESDAIPARLRSVALTVSLENLVVVEQGITQPAARLPSPERGQAYRPSLPSPDTAFGYRYERGDAWRPAAEVLKPSDRPPLPAVELDQESAWPRRWVPRRSLLDSAPGAEVFAVEVESDGSASLRFGDGVNGAMPAPGATLTVRQRVGVGAAGNVKAGAIAHVVRDDACATRVTKVSNPAPATGGADPEPLSSIQTHAPTAYRVNVRTVTAEDYVEQAKLHDASIEAQAAVLPGGAGPVALVAAWWGTWDDAGSVAERARLASLRQALRLKQPLGVDLDVRPAVPAPVDLLLDITVQREYSTELLRRNLDQVFARELLAPGRFVFGTPLYRSELVALALQTDGVVDATVPRLGWMDVPGPEPVREALVPPFGRIIRVADDLLAPSHGQLRYALRTAG